MGTTFNEVETGLLFIAIMILVIYYTDVVSNVLNKQITKRKLLVSIIPTMAWIILFVESINQLED